MPLREQHHSLLWFSRGAKVCSEVVLQVPREASHAVNIKSKRCLCGSTTPHFGLPGEPPGAARWCSKCPAKPPNAVDIKSRRCLCGSSTNPSFQEQ